MKIELKSNKIIYETRDFTATIEIVAHEIFTSSIFSGENDTCVYAQKYSTLSDATVDVEEVLARLMFGGRP